MITNRLITPRLFAKNIVHTAIIILCLLMVSATSFAQDPPQYGTPFTGVPDIRDVTMYQVNTRAFSAGGNFAGVTARLDSIKSLGINVIYLMPVQPVGSLMSVNSPYCIRNFDSVGSEFGTLADLRTLVDSAHRLNMAVIMDYVANQTSWDHPWIAEHPGWYLHDGTGAIEALSPYTDVAALNFSNDTLCKELDSVMRFWVFTANVDGFRCDFADNPPSAFWTQAIANLRTITTHTLIFLAEGVRSANYTSGFDYNFGYQSYDNSYKPIYASASPVTDIDNSNTVQYTGATGNQQVVRFLTNHDVNSSDGTPLTLFGGAAGSMALFVTVAYMKGIPFVYNGQEVDDPTQIVFPFTSPSETINWTNDYAAEAEYKKIIAFRNSSTAVRRGTLVSYDNSNVCAFTKISSTEKVAVFSNLRNSTQNFTLPSALAGTSWYDAFTGAPVSLGTSISLSAYQYMVLTNTVATVATTGPMVTTVPSPVIDGTGDVLIHFHPYWDTLAGTPGDAALRSFGGTIFIYTGLYTNPAPVPGAWNHQNPTWAASGSYYAMTRVDSNDYTYNMPDLRTYYGIGADSLIDTMNLIFKDSLGTMQSSTVYIPVSQPPTTGPMYTTTPSPVVDSTESVTITFHPYWDTVHATGGDTTLKTFGGTIFIYTGLYTNPSTGGWNHTNPTWAATSSYYAMTKIDSNDYTYTMSDLRSFYGVATGTIIDTMNVIFKDSLGTMQASTIYIPLRRSLTTESAINVTVNYNVLSLALAPNPALNEVSAIFSLGKNTDGIIRIINQVGQCVLLNNITNQNKDVLLYVKELPTGTYFVELTAGSQKVVQTLIKQ